MVHDNLEMRAEFYGVVADDFLRRFLNVTGNERYIWYQYYKSMSIEENTANRISLSTSITTLNYQELICDLNYRKPEDRSVR